MLAGSPARQRPSITYRSPEHEYLPHIVRFSGGRSSTMMTFLLAEAGALRPERGDLIRFANTSAEHPGTFAFASECKERLEQRYELPFIWYEFCTVEDASRGVYGRRSSYRLVRSEPIEADARGFRSGGEVFEELLSWQGQLPNPHSRSCTAKLKLYPSHTLLADWFGSGDGPRHDGHFADQSFVSPKKAFDHHRRNRGVQDEAAYLRRVSYVTEQPQNRPAQLWKDYTSAPIRKPEPDRSGPASLWGPGATQFVTLLGLRSDEKNRIGRVESRSLLAENAAGPNCAIRTQPPGARPYFPSAGWGEDAASVREFWSEHDLNPNSPESDGNCTFCFMKGTGELAYLARQSDPGRVDGSPSDIAWWAEIEARYRREAPSRNCGGHFHYCGTTTAIEVISAHAPDRVSMRPAFGTTDQLPESPLGEYARSPWG